ncbi:MAG: hypothetical protein AMXMBFR36_39050 [Acidobacteriota bacterium]
MRPTLAALLLSLGLAASGVADCLSWGPGAASLSGKLVSETFPGPPNYESIAKGDQPETHWILLLEKPVCVDGVDDLGQGHLEAGVERIQLVLTPELHKKHRASLGGIVEVTGMFMAAVSGHHHTRVLLEATELRESER